MTELERNEGGLVKLPAHIAARQDQAAYREATLDELRGWLEGEHRKALEENPLRQFTFKTPHGLWKDLTPKEKEDLQNFEQTTHARLQPLAREKADKRRFAIAAGSSVEAFEREWSEYGEEAQRAQRAEDIEERARRASSPY